MKDGRSKAGFTLAELLIVVAILGILMSVAVPLFIGVREKVSATVCLANRTMIARTLNLELITRPELNSVPRMREWAAKIIREAKTGESAYFDGPCVCVDGGEYSYRLGGIVCSNPSHGGAIGSGGVEVVMEDYMVTTLETIYTDKNTLTDTAFMEKYGFRKVDIRNDTVRSYLFTEVYEGSWPTFTEAFRQKNGLDAEYYIQPYVSGENLAGPIKDAIIFARQQGGDQGGWYADLYFSFEHDAWFQRSAPISGATEFKTSSALEENIKAHPELWRKLKN